MKIENLKEDLAKAFLLAAEATGQVLKPEEAAVQGRQYRSNFDLINSMLRNFWTKDFLEDLLRVDSGVEVRLDFLMDMHQRFEMMVLVRELLERDEALLQHGSPVGVTEDVMDINVSAKLRKLSWIHYTQSYETQPGAVLDLLTLDGSIFDYRRSLSYGGELGRILSTVPALTTLYLFHALGVWWEIKNGISK